MTATQNQPLSVAAFYKFVQLDELEILQGRIRSFLDARSITGTVLLASEGINGTIAGEDALISEFFSYLREGNVFGDAFRDLEPKLSQAGDMPFMRLRVRLKREIVTLRAEGVDPTREVGTYVAPRDWNALISDPDITLVDTRNRYETLIGTFAGAIDPGIDQFTEFKDFTEKELNPEKNKKIAMFCTGGIRCEKASAYLLALGFDEVYHLEGGILKYLEEIPEDESQWQGACFVFDERVGVQHNLRPSDHTLCRACRWPLDQDDRDHADFIAGVQCPRCKGRYDEAKRASTLERQRQVELAMMRGEAHMGARSRVFAEEHRAAKLAQKEQLRSRTGNR